MDFSFSKICYLPTRFAHRGMKPTLNLGMLSSHKERPGHRQCANEKHSSCLFPLNRDSENKFFKDFKFNI